MRHPRILIAGIGLAALAAAGGITAATAGGPSGAASASARSAATVRTASAAVGGSTEAILVNAAGQPLYYYRPDTATRSLVSGGLAQLWPPLTSAASGSPALSRKLTQVNDAHGHQVAYNGHLLYTFADDHAGQVTGQGVQNFFVATPGLGPVGTSPGAAAPAPAVPSAGHGY